MSDKETLELGFISMTDNSSTVDYSCDDCHGTGGCDSCDSCDDCHVSDD